MKLRLSLIPLVALAVLTAACGGGGPGNGGGDDPRVSVVASFFPLAELVRTVGGGHVVVADLTPPGAEPHDLELDTRDVDAVLDAELLVHLGHGFQPALEEIAAQRDGPTLDVLSAVLGQDAESGAVDPHIWLDPGRMSIAAAEVQEALTGVLPGAADELERNTAEFQDRLEALDAAYRATLRTCERDLLVTSHDAFGRLAERYGLRVEPIAGISPEAEPDPGRLAELADLVRREGVTTIFTETLVSAEVARTLANEAGVEVRVLNPIEGLTPEQAEADETYLRLMEANLASLAAGLGCTPA